MPTTTYVVFRSMAMNQTEAIKDGSSAWLEVGRAEAPSQRQAIIEVVGEQQLGSFMAVPESSAQVHTRDEQKRIVWTTAVGEQEELS